MQGSTLLKIVLGLIGVVLALLGNIEVDEDIFLTEKSVALTLTRAKVFQYISNLRNYAGNEFLTV